jgi:hypothetical protein
MVIAYVSGEVLLDRVGDANPGDRLNSFER